MITLHHLNNSRSQRVLWLLEELGVEYKIKPYQRDPKTMLAPPELKQVHPLGKSPVLEDNGVTVAESAVILEHLLDKYARGQLRPPAGTEASRRYTYFMHYAEGSLMPPLLISLIMKKITKPPVPFFLRPAAKMIEMGVKQAFFGPAIKSHIEFLEGELTKHKWFAGDYFTAADIQMSYPIEAMKERGDLKSHPKLLSYIESIHARPAYQRALKAGGPFSLAM